MNHPNFVILYVESSDNSARFYSDLLELQPVESSPVFAAYVLDSGLMFGLWARADVEPKVMAPAGGGELVFKVADRAAVDERYSQWQAMGLGFAQSPVDMEFGYTFVALDPDGNRLRVYSPAA
ncbi:hypothetical protein ADIMK_2984 [Marinobacterium lacunae]|uniref:VOC domain-containing protein n=1 Tax=Marinobacterium lacunae TaxID=1232683 RepID=A0A081FWH0_9GAMM|nr:VOC family protein [Marinobacterium lacunae]KEA62875.1 hypothetical protein ADIMK_2984 [Marinobacterium lacunae]